MSDRDDFGAFLLGFFIGGLTGAIVSLLLAPQSGEETRTVIKEKAIELRDVAEKTAGDTYSKASEVAAQTRDKAEEALTTAKKRVSTKLHRDQVMLEDAEAGENLPPAEA